MRKEWIMKIREKMGMGLVVIGLLWLIVPSLEAANIAEIKVKCDKGDSVQSALDSLTGPAIITVTGTCQENLVIKNDDITLQGGTYDAPDSERGTIVVQGARRVAITGVTVRGGLIGVEAYQGASLTLENSLIKENYRCGVLALFGSSLRVDSCEIKDNNEQGVVVSDNSALSLTNCTIEDNHMAGVLVWSASNARIGRSWESVLGPNQIKNNGGVGVNVNSGAFAWIIGNTLEGNHAKGVNIDGASAQVNDNIIAKNFQEGIAVQNSGSAIIGPDTLHQAGPNTIEENQWEGINISNGGSACISSNTIQNNGRTGVLIQHATAELLGGNTIKGNGGHGVQVGQGTLFQPVGAGPDLITKNAYSGIYAGNATSLDIRNAEVTNNTQNGILLGFQSTLRIYNSTVSGNGWDGIVLHDGSTVGRFNFNTPRDIITDNLGWGIACYGESKLFGETSNVSSNGAGDIFCELITP
jgi:hypothetical protein